MTDKERIAYLEYALAEREKELAKAYQSGAYVMKCEILNSIHSVSHSTLYRFFEDLLEECDEGEYGSEDLMTEEEFLEAELKSA
jgi:hypothetical protein